MSTFEEILNKPARDILPPQPLPVGTYLGVIEPQYEIKKAGETDVIEYKIRLLQAMDDVDSTAAATFPGGIMGTIRRYTLWGTNDPSKIETVRYYMKKFFVDTLDLNEDFELKQMVPEAVGRQLLVTIHHKPIKDGSRMVDEISATAKA